jgi:hypothetical protein
VSTDRGAESSVLASPRSSEREELTEGWYLMSTSDLERELAHRRGTKAGAASSGALRLTVAEALAYRDAGNLPDEQGRTLRLLLFARDHDEVRNLPLQRTLYEPDYHDPPKWRRQGSKPVNVVPLRDEMVPSNEMPWWEEPDVAALESEWLATGSIEGLRIPGDYRGFIYKTILSLRAQGREITATGVADSLARWLRPEDSARIRKALVEANAS